MKRLLIILLLPVFALAAADLPDMQVNLLEYDPSPIQPGQTADVYLEIASEESPTSNAWIAIVEDYPFTLLDTADSTRAQSLRIVSGTQRLQFRIRIAEGAKDGTYPLTVRFGSAESRTSYEEAVFDIRVETFDAKIGLVGIVQNPQRLVPGEKGELSLTFRNYDDSPLKNIDVMVDFTDSYDMSSNMNNIVAVQAMINARLEEVNRRIASGLSPLTGVTPMAQAQTGERKATAFTAVAPVGVSTQNRLPDLEGGEQHILSIPIQALPDTSPGIYAVPVYVSYNDADNNPFHVRVEIPVLVDMEPDIYVDLTGTTLRTTDFSGEVTFTVANRGLSDLRYVTVELGEDESVELLTAPKSTYVGDLLPGEAQDTTFTVIAHEDEIVLPLRVTYRDAFNERHELETDIPFTIINKNYYRDLPYEMWLAWIILGIVVLGLTAFYVARMRK